MTFRSPSSSTSRNLILLWASIAIVMALAVMWGATRTHDPLSDFIHTDKMRHIMAFGAIGLCAGLMPTRASRLVGLGAVLTFAMAIEIIQIPIPDRSASVSDVVASGIGGFAGFGLGAAVFSLLAVMRADPNGMAREELR
jgi:VanZ family protein